MNNLEQFAIRGSTAAEIIESIERGVQSRALESGARLPTVRELAKSLGVSPATVAAAYRSLQSRGIVHAQGRRGTQISHRPLHPPRPLRTTGNEGRNLYDGNPDPCLLPPMKEILKELDPTPLLYGSPLHEPELLRITKRELIGAGVPARDLCVTSGALDGIERVLAEECRNGDRIGVEDPGFGCFFDLAISRGLSLIPIRIDQEGLLPDQLERACKEGIKAVILTPRVQNPTGARLSRSRARELTSILLRHPEVVVIEDDHASLISDAPLCSIHERHSPRWVHVHSFSKALNPDLRLAVLTGDDLTVRRVKERLLVGERWVSHLLQRMAVALLKDRTVRRHLDQAAATYSQRRTALMNALRHHGYSPEGSSGYNVWIPVKEETPAVQALADRGWTVAAGERFRIVTPPAIRITAATLAPEESAKLAHDFRSAHEQATSPRSV